MTSIMVVDDEVFIVDLYRDILKLKGYEVIATAYDGDEAVQKYRVMDRRPDIVILDHRMPNKDGIETMTEILALNSMAKILFVSADIMIEKDALKNGARGFLPKPFRMDELVEYIDKLAKT
ncbi:MAG: response regulator [Thermoplasmata archaeon]|nr:response regulator [Thermoplasmata archaeon]